MSGETSGKDFLVYQSDGGSPPTYTLIAGMRSTKMTVTNQSVDVTSKQSVWRTLIAGGVTDVELSLIGIFSSDSDFQHPFAGDIFNLKLVNGSGFEMYGAFKFTKSERRGEFKDSEVYSYTIASAGIVSSIIPDPGPSGSCTLVNTVISPSSSAITNVDLITITSATSGVTIYYTVDGTTPTTSSLVYSVPFSLVSGSRIVKAFSVKFGLNDSAVTTENYTVSDIDPPWVYTVDGSAFNIKNYNSINENFAVATMARSLVAGRRSIVNGIRLMDSFCQRINAVARSGFRSIVNAIVENPNSGDFYIWGNVGTTFVGNWTSGVGNTIAATTITAASGVTVDVTLAVNPSTATKYIGQLAIGPIFAGQTVQVYGNGVLIRSAAPVADGGFTMTLPFTPTAPGQPLRVIVAARAGGNVISSISFFTAPYFPAG